MTLFGGVLAGIGAYGVMAFEVGQRTREAGIRIALGAPTAAVLRRVVGRGMTVAAVGAMIGLLLAHAASTLLQGILYGVNPVGAVIIFFITTVLVGVGILASVLPVLRVARLDPVKAIRSE